MRYADATLLWRFALPRAGWGRTAPRARLPTRPLSQSQSNREESLKRQAWPQYRSGSRVPSGVWLSVMGAVQSGPSTGFSKLVPPFAAQAFRHELHQGMATCSTIGTEGVMVVERSGSQRAHTRDATLTHYQSQWRFPCLPAPGGPHLNPLEGFWRVMKDASGAGRCFPALPQLDQRTRHVLMAPQERPMYAFHW